MGKSPKNTPSVGERCELRGKLGRVGEVLKIDKETNWVAVKWPDNFGPHICHLFELQTVVNVYPNLTTGAHHVPQT